jgi:hypothetical protein
MKPSNGNAPAPLPDTGRPTFDERAQELFHDHPGVREPRLTPQTCRHAVVVPVMRDLAARSGGNVECEEAGHSVEGRAILHLRAGSGPLPVLLWSQMHGDEPTATQALADVLRFLPLRQATHPWVREILDRLTLHCVPLLNPDGAEIPRRTNAGLIDLNRDARLFATPEARVLREVHNAVRPTHAFNLHDQWLSSVGATGRPAALALLAPAPDELRTVTPARLAAMKMGAAVVRAVGPFAAGNLSVYDDSFEPRAFGDTVQSWGTSTLLIESGHWPGDPDKTMIRRLNFVAILAVLSALADGSLDSFETGTYLSLAPNGKRSHALIVRNVTLRHTSGWSRRADLGYSRDAMMEGPLLLKEVGDLAMFGALEERDGSELLFNTADLVLESPLDDRQFC